MKWTFGIPTDGRNDERIIQVLTSLLRQIPTQNYEVLICGNSKINLPNCRVIPFKELPNKIWITKKKNILCSQAQFENICLFHDYFTFAPNWYESFLRFGSDWDVTICNIKNKGGGRLWCWVMEQQYWQGKQLDFQDRSHVNTKMYCSGGWYCVKKSFALDNPLDERLMWAEAEDVEWSRRCRDRWNYRINTDTWVQSLKQK